MCSPEPATKAKVWMREKSWRFWLPVPQCAAMLQLPCPEASIGLHSELPGSAGRLGPRKLGASVKTPDSWGLLGRRDWPGPSRPAGGGRSRMLPRLCILTGHSPVAQSCCPARGWATWKEHCSCSHATDWPQPLNRRRDDCRKAPRIKALKSLIQTGSDNSLLRSVFPSSKRKAVVLSSLCRGH
ncbi:hypothetical protein VTI28DRAFT_1514 [Corynascus sepedonium]